MIRKIRRWLLRLQWRQQHYQPHIEKNLERHTCPYCKEVYVGNLCPQCGLKDGRDRLTPKTVGLNMMDLWGLGNRNAFQTMWHLLWRPGYMIGDYLRGKSQAYFPPVALLVALCVVFSIMVSLCNIDFKPTPNIAELMKKEQVITATDTTAVSTENAELDKMMDELMTEQLTSLTATVQQMQAWSHAHLEYSMLLTNLIVILITSWVFRNSPRLGRMTLIENLYVQMFIDCQMMLIAIPYTLVTQVITESEFYPYLLPTALAFIILVYDYYQLCGFGLWRTVWKVTLMTAVYTAVLGVITVVATVVYIIGPPLMELIKMDPPV